MSEWLWPLQKLVNEALQYDPGATQKLASLAGKTIVLKVTSPDLSVSLCIENEGFVLLVAEEIQPFHARITGKASDLFAVLRAEDRTAAMMAHHIQIEGDTATFFTLQSVMSHLDIDWEMALGDRIGDMAAHVVADGVRFLGSMAQHQARSFDRTARNFLREESGWWVPTSLWADHKRSVQTLRLDADRLQAKILLLQQKLSKRQPNV